MDGFALFQKSLGKRFERYGGFLFGLREAVRRYERILRWLTLDSVWRYRGMVFIVVVTGFFGITFQIAAIGQAVYYAKLLKDGLAIMMLGQQFDPRTSHVLLALFAFGILLALLFSAGLVYFSNSRNVKVGRRFEEFCSKRVVHALMVNPPALNALTGGPYNRAEIVFLSTTASRQCGIACRLLVDMITPGMTFVVSLCFLLYTNAVLTGILGIILLFSLPFLWKINVQGAQSSVHFEEFGKTTNRERLQLIQQLTGVAVPSETGASWIEKTFEKPVVRDYLDAYEGRIIAPMRANFITHAVLAVSVCSLLLVFGEDSITRGAGWARLIIYLVAVRYCLSNLLQVSTGITNTNRFYPTLKRYFHFLRSVDLTDNHRVSWDSEVTLAPIPSAIEGSADQWELTKGTILGLVAPLSLDRLTLNTLLGRLIQPIEGLDRLVQSVWFVAYRYSMPPIPLKAFLGLRDHNAWEDFRDLVEGSGLWVRLGSQVPQNLDGPISTESWDSMDIDLRHALGLFAALQSKALWIAFDVEVIDGLPQEAKTFFLRRLRKRIALIFYNRDPKKIGRYGEHVVAVLNNKGLAGLGTPTWAQAHMPQIESTLLEAKRIRREEGVVDDESRDLDLEMDL